MNDAFRWNEWKMTTKRKRWSEMTTEELAAATREFDDPDYDPPAQKPTPRQLAQLRRVQRKAAKDRFRVGAEEGRSATTRPAGPRERVPPRTRRRDGRGPAAR